MSNKNNKITYCKLHWKRYNFLDFAIINFYCKEEIVPFCIESLAKYKHYNVVLNEDYLLGPDVSIWDFTINDLPYIWMWDVETGENTIRAEFTETPDNTENKTLEKIMQDLCDILNMLVENGEIQTF
ncbi:hypothetical protein CQA53_10750 [Helicobacter didelphidarum]|uniref:Uncharacterized protein n=1 Tax=Helicobacter didelphidarum TaxID=2040648 RepID=A0A3D8I628_9HELI|nr:hypothetical protein [Helicobacter didelphidarum]RDU60630.1 hypothetical protein CQA53_10750 [Helicobacter didelphidarum]